MSTFLGVPSGSLGFPRVVRGRSLGFPRVPSGSLGLSVGCFGRPRPKQHGHAPNNPKKHGHGAKNSADMAKAAQNQAGHAWTCRFLIGSSHIQ
eukprot:7205667-Lingulodinium_polyedra.AAC.1